MSSSNETVSYRTIMPVFNEIVTLLYSLEDDGITRDDVDPVALGTSCAAFAGALYLMKHSGILSGTVGNEDLKPYYEETGNLFQYVSGACLRAFENEEDRTITPDSDEGTGIIQHLCDLQSRMMMEYLELIVKTIAELDAHPAPGAPVLGRLTSDIYKQDVRNPHASLTLMRHVLDHIPCPSPEEA